MSIEYFVYLDGKKELREEVLEISHELVGMLQRTEKVRRLQRERANELEKVKVKIKEIAQVSRDLRRSLPNLKMVHVDEEAEDKTYAEQLDALEKSIDDIENKLKNLD